MFTTAVIGMTLLTPPDLPINQWQLLHSQAPNIIWENGVAWDHSIQKIVWHGGHIGRIYPQSNYTFIFDPVQNRFFESQAPSRPQRRCLIHVAYLETHGRVITTDGSSSHGSIPTGGIAGEYNLVYRSDARGPWLYDAVNDVWEDCRTLPPIWQRAAHTPIAYEPQSDALFSLHRDKLNIYLPQQNRVMFEPLPPQLHNLLSYGLVADPVNRKLVVFGGTITTRRPEQVNGKNVYDTVTYDFTWVYDIVKKEWQECQPKIRPPKGVPGMGSLSLQMVWHDPSATVLLMQNATNERSDNSTWPPAELWSFDTKTGQWQLVPMNSEGLRPSYMGLLTYSRERDELFMFGGGRDGGGNLDSNSIRLGSSRLVWSCRVQVPDHPHKTPPPPIPLRLIPAKDHVRLEWKAADGALYRVYRAVCDGLIGGFENITTIAADSFVDRTPEPGKIYAYRIVSQNDGAASLPVYNQPRRPGGLKVSLENTKEVRLRWTPDNSTGIVGYRVYRAKGAAVVNGEKELLTPTPLAVPHFVDKTSDFSDGVICAYWVTTVNNAGIESGASPLAYTAPDAPDFLTVPEGVGPSDDDGIRHNYVVSWHWPKDLRVAGFNIYGAPSVPNNSDPQFLKTHWKKLNDTPWTKTEYIYTDPTDGQPCRYFYIRAVNILGQEGFCTDTVSPTDRCFRP